jgi:hypothetical protein
LHEKLASMIEVASEWRVIQVVTHE